MFANLRVGTRMALACGLLGVLFAAVCLLAFRLASDQRTVSSGLSEDTDDVQLALTLQYGAADLNGWQTAYAFDALRGVKDAAADNGESRAAFLKAADALRRDLDVLDQRPNLDATEHQYAAEVRKAFDEFMALDAKVAEGYRLGTPASVAAANDLVIGREIELYNAMSGTAKKLSDTVMAEADGAAADADTGAARAQVIVAVLVLVSLVLGVALVVGMTRSVTRPLLQLRDRLRAIGSKGGDLHARLDASRKDEFGEVAEAFNTFVAGLDASLSQVSEHAITVAAASEELAAVSAQLTGAASDSAKRTTLISDGAAHVATNAGVVDSRASDTAHVAQNAVSVSRDLSSVVQSLGSRSADIAGMIDSVRDITEQIDLLALNATIEAARAGEAGRSFAVVAAEVKSLANASGTATKNITTTLTAIESDVEAVLGSLNRMTDVVDEADRNAREITEASSGQRRDAQQMADEAAALASSVEETRTAAGDVNQASHELATLAQSLNDLVSRYIDATPAKG